jgi:glutamyl-tRNA reductase
MLVNVTFSLPEETVDRLRKAAKEVAGGRKGAISSIVEAAIMEHLREIEARKSDESFRAVRGGKEVARAPTLRELGSKLRTLKVDPRDVLVLSSTALEPTVKTGLRRQVQ